MKWSMSFDEVVGRFAEELYSLETIDPVQARNQLIGLADRYGLGVTRYEQSILESRRDDENGGSVSVVTRYSESRENGIPREIKLEVDADNDTPWVVGSIKPVNVGDLSISYPPPNHEPGMERATPREIAHLTLAYDEHGTALSAILKRSEVRNGKVRISGRSPNIRVSLPVISITGEELAAYNLPPVVSRAAAGRRMASDVGSIPSEPR